MSSKTRTVVIGNNGVDLHIADEYFEPICTADCRASAADIKEAWNGTYGQGIDPSTIKEMYEALVAIIELHDLGGLAEMVELGTKDVFSHAKIVLQMCRISIEKAKI